MKKSPIFLRTLLKVKFTYQDLLTDGYYPTNGVEFSTGIKHKYGAFKNKLTFNFRGEKEGCCAYDTVQENQNTVNFENGISVRGKVKPKNIQLHLDFQKKQLKNSSLIPYLRFELSRGSTRITPYLGSIFFWKDIKVNGLLQLVDNQVNFKHRAEWLKLHNDIKYHFAWVYAYSLTNNKAIDYKSSITVSKGKVEGSVKCLRSGESKVFGPPESIDLGLHYKDEKTANFGIQAKIDPSNAAEGKKDLWLSVGKTLAPNFYAKAKFNWFSTVASYYVNYKVCESCSVASTFEINHAKTNEKFSGCCDYPFNFGLQFNINA